MIQTLIDWLVNAITLLGYPGVFISVFLESFFAPIPSEIILPFSGFVASTGELNILLVILIATLGAYLGSLPFFFIGKWGEKPLLKFLNRFGKYLFIQKDDIDRVFQVFDKYGNKVVLFGRLIPIVRTLISFPAGVAKMNFTKFTIFTILGSLLWNILLTYTGYILGDHWDTVGTWVSKYENIILALGAFAIILYVGRGIKSSLRARVKKR